MSALEIFVKLAGIDGDSTARGHEREIVVLSYEQSVDATLYHSGGGGSAVGKTTFHGARFRKNADMASIPILLACASGTHIAHARFAFRRSGTQLDFYTVTLEDLLVTHVAQRAGAGAQYPLAYDTLAAGAPDDGLLDEITLAFSRIRWDYRSQDPKGAIAAVSGGWDLEAHHKL
jgi:type VI secretion system secreted protein Hcp